jgi:CBS-domain-containing membrane protein
MRPKKNLSTLDYNELSRATIGDVIIALKDSGQQHCLVVDKDSNKIRGIFSASDISRKLHLSIDIQEKSSFYKVFSATT